jgi:copper transport protein
LGLLAPPAASAHAYLVHTSPTASELVESPPRQVALTFDEAVEPRFAIISVTDVDGRQQTTGPVRRSAVNPDTIVVPVRPGLPQGWYLVYWRAISVDGHPVSGVFTFAVGPDPGPAPQFVIPHVSATAKTPGLLVTRWLMFISVMVAIGLLVLRLAIARPGGGRHLRPLSVTFVGFSLAGLVAIPVYLDFATANDALRSVFDVGALVPLYSVTAFGRGLLKLELCFALFCVAAWVALWVDRPDRPLRSVAELLAGTGAALAAAAVLIIPGTIGHAGQTSPRGLAIALDATHVAAGSIWLGGLVGLLVLWFSFPVSASADRLQLLRVAVPRFSAVALVSVIVLLGTGTGATIIHMPVLSALWQTGYGVAILVKIGLLALAMCLAAVNLTRTRPRLATIDDRSPAASRLLRTLVSGEAVIVGGAVFVATLLSSLAPPPPSFALGSSALARVGPGRVVETVERGGYRLQVLVSPNKAAEPNSFGLRITKNGAPVTGASVTLTFNQLDMQMPTQQYQLKETSPGVYARAASALVMVGRWSLAFDIAPKGGPAFTALIDDQANG